MKNRFVAAITLAVMITTMLFGSYPVNARENTVFSLDSSHISLSRGEDFTFTISGEELAKLYAL